MSFSTREAKGGSNANEMRNFVEEYVKALNSNDVNAVEKFHSDLSVSKSGEQPGSAK